MQRTPLNSVHRALGAKMVEFGGWDMPVQYSGIIDEHTATRTAAGLYDICHMGEFIIQGGRALELLQQVTTNDVAQLKVNQCHYSTMCTETGGVIDDLIVYRIDDDKYMTVVNAATRAGDFAWLQEHNENGVTLEDVSEQTAKLDLQGPKSRDILKKLVPEPEALDALKYFRFIETTVDGREAIVSRTGYTGELGFELYITAREAEPVWNKLLETGADHGLKPCGLGARDTLRLEAGLSLYGHELDADHTPLEAGLGWVVKFAKGGFIGRDALLAQKEGGLARRLVAFQLEKRAVARHGCAVYADGRECGAVTSGSFGPSVGKTIGLAYVEAGIESAIEVAVRNKKYAASIVELPFYKDGTARD